MKSYMITFTGDSGRTANFHKTKSTLLPDLILYKAIDTINYYNYWKEKALQDNLCSQSYISEETDKTPGKLGCNLSYLYLFHEIAAHTPDSEWTLILEDDAQIKEGFKEFIDQLIPQLTDLDTEYVNLYADPAQERIQFSSSNHLKEDFYKLIPQYYTLGQLIKTSGVKKILASCPINENIDFWRNNNLDLLSSTIVKNNYISNGGSIDHTSHDKGQESAMGSLIWDSRKKQPPQILFQMHIMWYESEMLNETLDSIQKAVENSPIPVKVVLGLNSQTYIEKPEEGEPSEMFSAFSNHPLLKQPYTTVYNITNEEPFYNIGDWRREVYNPESIYTVWGESDCLVPSEYFKILHSTDSQIPYPHFMTLASRKMWDSSWDIMEHPSIREYPRGPNRENISELYAKVPPHLASELQITYQELESFNKNFQPEVKLLKGHKVDGSLLAISKNFPTPFIGENVRFAREDTCFETFCRIKRIPQFIVETKIKGHNYHHPLKRTNTQASRTDDTYKLYEQESIKEINFFLSNLSQNTELHNLTTAQQSKHKSPLAEKV